MLQSSILFNGASCAPPVLGLPRKPSTQASLSKASSVKVPVNNRERERSIFSSTESIERIREQLQKVQAPASSYDTAWVAMVPDPSSPRSPCFPQCVDWILENQNSNGSWGISGSHPSLIKGDISSTLACILALKKWNSSEEHIKKGLHFMESNFSSIFNEKLISPVGFNLIFPSMVKYAIDMHLNLPYGESALNDIFTLQNLELKRVSRNNSKGANEYMAYISEGLGKYCKDEDVINKYQRANGSLFNSPSSTAFSLTQIHNTKALDYLTSLLQKSGPSVPTLYPFEIYTQLLIIDTLQKVGIARYFSNDIKRILDKIYRLWLERDEEIISDMSTCAMAFRNLRLNGYNVSSDILAQYEDANKFCDSKEGYLRNMRSVIELYKASQMKLFPNEEILENIASWTSNLLKKEISSNSVISQEVDFALKFPFYADLDRLEHKRNIEGFLLNRKQFEMHKSTPMFSDISEDIFELSMKDFSESQSIYKQELELLERWVRETKLDQLKFARQKLTYCYLSAASTIYFPELSKARIVWAKNAVLTTVVDDFFDVGGSMEELENLISLFEKWDGKHNEEFYSKQVEIVFSATHGTINEIGTMAREFQDRDITNHLIKIWLDLLRSMMNEAKWFREKTTPTKEEYMRNGIVSFALGPIILPAIYFVGPKISEEIISHQEYDNLFRLVSKCGRLLNDMQGFEKEGFEILTNSGNFISTEEAKKEIQKSIGSSRRELLQMVLKEGSVVPKPCKELFWKMCKIVHLFYMNNDGYSSPKEMVGAVNAVIHEPLKILA